MTPARPAANIRSVSYYPPLPPPQGNPVYDAYRPAGGSMTPARRASIVMWVIGPLLCLCGTCVGVAPWAVPFEQLAGQIPNLTPEQKAQMTNPQMVTMVRVIYSAMGVGGGLVGLALLIAATFVGRGRRWAIVIALVAFAILGIWCIISVLSSLIALSVNPAFALGGALFWLVVSGVVGLAVTWLIQALRAATVKTINRLRRTAGRS